MSGNFKKMRGLRLPYAVQGRIFFTCLCYDILTPREKRRIERLCGEVGGEHRRALFALLTGRGSVISTAMNSYVSESTLYRLRRDFFNLYAARYCVPPAGKRRG